MNADTWHSLKEIIADAMELAPEQRDGFIAAAAGGDRGLLSEARELLKFNDSGCIAVSDDSIPFDDLSHDPPSMLGPYRILRELGRGGSGIVYLAERNSPFHKLVAVKVLSYCVEELYRRFQVERQILAGLEHPFDRAPAGRRICTPWRTLSGSGVCRRIAAGPVL